MPYDFIGESEQNVVCHMTYNKKSEECMSYDFISEQNNV